MSDVNLIKELIRTYRDQGDAQATAMADVLSECNDIPLAFAILKAFKGWAEFGMTRLDRRKTQRRRS